MKMHSWTEKDDELLKKSVEDCSPIFEHFKSQNKNYKELNAWDAVAGRLLPDICVTGAACRRRWEIMKEKAEKSDAWDKVAEMVDKYERDLAETTFDGVADLLGSSDALMDSMGVLLKTVHGLDEKISKLIEMWK